MDYNTQHIRSFLQENTIFKISKLEDLSNVPRDTIKHFLKERREIPQYHLDNVVSVLIKYGYKPLNSE